MTEETQPIKVELEAETGLGGVVVKTRTWMRIVNPDFLKSVDGTIRIWGFDFSRIGTGPGFQTLLTWP